MIYVRSQFIEPFKSCSPFHLSCFLNDLLNFWFGTLLFVIQLCFHFELVLLDKEMITIKKISRSPLMTKGLISLFLVRWKLKTENHISITQSMYDMWKSIIMKFKSHKDNIILWCHDMKYFMEISINSSNWLFLLKIEDVMKKYCYCCCSLYDILLFKMKN
jgi:hypothetical protein